MCKTSNGKWRSAKLKNRFVLSMTPYAPGKATLLWILQVSQKNYCKSNMESISARIQSLAPENKLTCNLNCDVCKQKNSHLLSPLQTRSLLTSSLSLICSLSILSIQNPSENEPTCLTIVQSVHWFGCFLSVPGAVGVLELWFWHMAPLCRQSCITQHFTS